MDERFLKLWPFKALRPPRLQFLTNSCRFFLALFSADFSRDLLLFISAVRMFRLSSCCTTCPLAVSLHLQVVFTVSFLYFSVCFVCCCIFCRLTAFLSVSACFCILFSLLVIFHVHVHSFVPPLIWAVKPSRFYYILFPRVQLAGLRSQGLLIWAQKAKSSFILYFLEC